MDKTKKFMGYLLLAVFLVTLIYLPLELQAQNKFDYELMEPIPGFESASKFPKYLVAVYSFLVWTAGICAMLMVIIGGFIYVTSTGTPARTEKAKSIIFNAVLGLGVVFASWVLLRTINPDLTKIDANLDLFKNHHAPTKN